MATVNTTPTEVGSGLGTVTMLQCGDSFPEKLLCES